MFSRMRQRILLVACIVGSAPSALAAETERVSLGQGDVQGNGLSESSSISGNGRYIAFTSEAANLVPGDTNGFSDVFVRDRVAGTTERISVSTNDAQGDNGSLSARVSANGRWAAFVSFASNLVPGDTNDQGDVFVHDRRTGKTERVNVSTGDAQANGEMLTNVDISGDGRLVAFPSCASNLVPDDTNNSCDVFIRDRETHTTSRVNVGPGGVQCNVAVHAAFGGNLSLDGRYVAFTSRCKNLVDGRTNGDIHAFVRDLQTGVNELVSRNSAGVQAKNGGSGATSLSADGRFVVFESNATNLVPGDTNGTYDVFVRDRTAGTTERISVSTSGAQGNSGSGGGQISADGRFVAFSSNATNLVARDTNGVEDIFVHDRLTGTTRRASVKTNGAQGNGNSGGTGLSANGKFMVFTSDATNLVPADTNGAADVFVRTR